MPSEWLQIESAPRDGREVIVYNAESDQYWIASWWKGEQDFVEWREGTSHPISCTHWQPLPPPRARVDPARGWKEAHEGPRDGADTRIGQALPRSGV